MEKRPFKANSKTYNVSFKLKELPKVGQELTIVLDDEVINIKVEDWMLEKAVRKNDRFWIMPYSKKSMLYR